MKCPIDEVFMVMNCAVGEVYMVGEVSMVDNLAMVGEVSNG